MNRRGFLGLLVTGAASTILVPKLSGLSGTTYFLPPIGGWSPDYATERWYFSHYTSRVEDLVGGYQIRCFVRDAAGFWILEKISICREPLPQGRQVQLHHEDQSFSISDEELAQFTYETRPRILV